jgi:hypothetical protein
MTASPRNSRKESFGLVRVLTLVLAGVGAAAIASPAVAAEVPVVLALDASRSLSAAESRATASLAKEILAGLEAATPAGVLVFDDEVRWLARLGTSRATASAALDALAPKGKFTVLNDGLIEGVRALPEGGVLVLLSDGMDENSATTFDDAARLASDRDVRVVTVGAGRADEKTLRRLALLTGGAYAGRTATLDASALISGVEALRDEVEAERASRKPAGPSPEEAAAARAAALAAAAPAPAPVPASPSPRWLLLVGAAVAAFGIVLGFLLARRRAAASSRTSQELERGTRPGVQWPASGDAPANAPAAAWTATGTSPGTAPGTSPVASGGASFSAAPQAMNEVEIARVRLRAAVRPQGLMEISLDETAEFQRLPFSESIERTLVLTAEVVLTVREPGKSARSFRLPPDRAIDIGRDAGANALAFQDPTMSTQHLRLSLEDDEIFLVDLGSTNGVLVGERRVDAVRLHPGDHFRAGMIEFELGLHHASMGRSEGA